MVFKCEKCGKENNLVNIRTDENIDFCYKCWTEITVIISEIKHWLGPEGIEFFRRVKQEHGSVNAVWDESGIPHSTHFREGMQIRNKLREFTENAWTAHEYDDRWVFIVEEAIK